MLSKVRARLSPSALIQLVGAVFGAAMVAILVRSTVVVVIVLIPAGMAWVGMLATVNTLLQLFLPRWVRARGLSVYQMVLFGAQGLGAVAWGAVDDAFGLTRTFLVAAGLMILGSASVRLWPFVDVSGMDRRTVIRPDPDVTLDTDVEAGPVVIRTTYSIRTEREPDFLRAMLRVRESRLRTGATQWGLFRNGERLGEFEEIFVVASWDEHLRQHRERMTATDLAYEEEAKAFSDPAPQTWHLLPTDLDER
jgi:MFS family permease